MKMGICGEHGGDPPPSAFAKPLGLITCRVRHSACRSRVSPPLRLPCARSSLTGLVPLEDLKTGGKRAIARALSRLDRTNLTVEDAALLDEAFAAPLGMVIGLTGPPGVGKSTLTQALIERLRATGKSVAVIAVDPSSQKPVVRCWATARGFPLTRKMPNFSCARWLPVIDWEGFRITPSPRRCCCALCSTWCWSKRSA